MECSNLYVFVFFLTYRIRSKAIPNDWLYFGYATFQIYSRYAPEGTPIQYRDIVAFKYPFGGYTAWFWGVTTLTKAVWAVL